MLRRKLGRLLAGAAFVAAACVVDVPRAEAFWGHGSSGGSYGGSSGGSSGGSYGGSQGSYGGRGGWFQRRHARRGMRAYYQSSGGSSGGWGYAGYGGSSGGYGYASSGGGYSYGSWGSSGGYYGDTMMRIESAAPVGEAAPYEEGPPPPPPGDDELPADADAPTDADAPPDPDEPNAGNSRRFSPLMRTATLNVRVPLEAKVYVNGLATTSRGSLRRYISNGLLPGYSYSYELRAELVQGDRILSETKTIKLEAGQSSNVEFAFADRDDSDERVAAAGLRTSLTLHVPADARVYLSGNETRSFGEVRHFSTTRLAKGDQWQDYEIKVEVDRDGQTLAKEQTVSLAAGDAREVTIDFGGPELALTASK